MDYESVDILELPKVKTKNIRCIYFLYKDEELVYIGKSINLFGRLFSHLMNKNKEFNYLRYLEVPEIINLDELEKFYILKYKPIYNIQFKVKEEKLLSEKRNKEKNRYLKELKKQQSKKKKEEEKQISKQNKLKEEELRKIKYRLLKEEERRKEAEDQNILYLLNDIK